MEALSVVRLFASSSTVDPKRVHDSDARGVGGTVRTGIRFCLLRSRRFDPSLVYDCRPGSWKYAVHCHPDRIDWGAL